MLDAARRAVSFMAGRTQHDLVRDDLLAYAVQHAIQIVGEAAFQLSDAAKAETPDLPWPQIIGMRHRLVHAYHNVDPEKVWKTTQEDLPMMVRVLERIVDS